MSRSDYLLLSAALRRAYGENRDYHYREGVKRAALEIADSLSRITRSFDHARFMHDCGIPLPY